MTSIKDKIIVIGSPGSGKSTFARKLRDASGLPLFYLDTIYHNPDRTTVSREEFDSKLADILSRDCWIIDGNYLRTLPLRLAAAEQVFFFDLPLDECLKGAESRIGSKREDLPWTETEFDEEFRQYIIDFPGDQLPEIRKMLADCGDTKDIVAFRSHREADNFVQQFGYEYVALRERPELMGPAAEWFQSKWGVPREAYLECMQAYLSAETELGWYLCLCDGAIVGGLGVIENDFHDRKDLAPNVCAVYTEEAHRRRGIAGRLLNMAVEDMRSKGISPLYLVTDHTGFYERYGWEFFCMVQGDGEDHLTRMYIHR